MKVSLNWLREFVDFSGDASELAELLTRAGVEVEGIENRGVAIDKVVVAQILESNPHPNADRLSVCRVDDGSGTPRQIVCGAKNYKVGDKVPLALPGAILPGDFKIKVGKLRGVESEGMLCSAKELRLADDADGLLILPESAQIGAPLAELLPADTILDLEITPNRADLLSHIGIAREVAALTGRKLIPHNQKNATNSEAVRGQIEIAAPEKCPFYTARKISNVKVGPSPAWLKSKLESVGVRAINNVVDVTNFVMLEIGQPLHAFDAEKLRGKIRVRDAREAEEFLALDGGTYKLNSENLVIADEARAIAIAGVMGGEETGVTESTREVILESAYFQPSNIRRTARGLGLTSDSSYRFERGVDPDNVIAASQRAVDLICEIAGGEPTSGLQVAGAKPDFTRLLNFRPARCEHVLGAKISSEKIDEILSGFGLEKIDGAWKIPSFRQDLTREIDLIEEIIRVFGIEQIPARVLARIAGSTATDRAHEHNMRVRKFLADQGFFETRTLSLISEKAVRHQYFPAGELRRVKNPLNEDQVVLRPAIAPGLIESFGNNVRAGTRDVRLFEIGRIFRAEIPEERPHLGLLISGAAAAVSWRDARPRMSDLFDLKGVISTLGLGDFDFENFENPNLALSLAIKHGGETVGYAGQLLPSHARELDVTAPVLIAEIDLSALPPREFESAKFRAISKFPAVTRDIAVIAPPELRHGEIAKLLKSADEPLLADVQLFDVFAGEKMESGRKSLAYSLTYRAADRTLNTEEVNAAHARLKERLRSELGVAFRE